MNNTLIVGGTKGIGLAISKLLSQENCIIISRSDYVSSSSLHHHIKLDVMHDDLPELENIQNIYFQAILIYNQQCHHHLAYGCLPMLNQ